MKTPKLENAMTKSILSVRWNLAMKEAWKLMEARGVRHLPVMSEDGQLIGILSDRDVKRAMDPKSPTFSQECIVGDYMSWPVMTVEADASLLDAVNTMLGQKISSLVVTKQGMPSGIVTSEDMLRLLRDLLSEGDSGRRLRLIDPRYSVYVQEILHEAESAGI